MRIILAAALLGSGAFCGCIAALSYKKRVDALLCCELFLERLAALLSLENLPTDVLFFRLSEMEELKSLAFIRKTAEGLLDTCDFPTVFRGALQEKGALNEEDAAILLRLAGLIGSYELERQLSGIAAVKELIGIQRQKAVQRHARDGKTVRSLGILGGIAAAIFVV